MTVKTFASALLAGVLLASCATGKATVDPAEVDAVAYRVSPVMTRDNKISALHVEMSFRVDADGSTVVWLPSNYAGQSELWRNLRDFKIHGGEFGETDKPDERIITAAAGTPVTFSYDVHSGIDHPPTDEDQLPYRPWIFDDWFFIDGRAAFSVPDLPRDTPATFRWTGPAWMTFASDLEPLSAPGSGANTRKMIASTMLGGRDVRILSTGATRLALHGTFAFSDQELLDGVAHVLKAERTFWEAPVDTPFLVTMSSIAGPPTGGSFAGTSFGEDAFQAVVAGKVDLPFLLSMLFGHEILHAWMPGALGDTRAGPDGEGWFGEGFTDYYARKISARSGVISADDFVELWNNILLEYMTSPARNYDNWKVTEQFWSDFPSSRMPYMRGAIFAALLDGKLRSESNGTKSLDDVLRAQRARAAGARDGPPLEANSLTALLVSVSREHGVDIAADLAGYIDRGDTILLPPDSFGPCFQVERIYDDSFDLAASAQAHMVATGVRTDGPAWRAGLRDGMQILKMIAPGAPGSELAWQVKADEEERTIAWPPSGAGADPIQRIVLVPPPGGAQCSSG